jgi:DNA-binding NtrC family response regulator
MATILILEDSKLQAELITRLVMRAGWSAVVAKSHETALAALRDSHMDLLLLDVYVGEMNTLGNLNAFRTAAANVPIAIMSAGVEGQTSGDALGAAQQAGACALLAKPFGAADLTKLIRTVLEIPDEPN